MIIGFDWDGTLVESWTAMPLPGVRERLAGLPPDTRTFIASNQAGPVWRAMTGEMKYPTEDEVVARITKGLQALDWRPDLLLIATHCGREDGARAYYESAAANRFGKLISRVAWFGPMYHGAYAEAHYRKPGVGMFEIAVGHFAGRVGTPIDCYVGDMDTDRQAAIAANCRYLDAAAWRERGL